MSNKYLKNISFQENIFSQLVVRDCSFSFYRLISWELRRSLEYDLDQVQTRNMMLYNASWMLISIGSVTLGDGEILKSSLG